MAERCRKTLDDIWDSCIAAVSSSKAGLYSCPLAECSFEVATADRVDEKVAEATTDLDSTKLVRMHLTSAHGYDRNRTFTLV